MPAPPPTAKQLDYIKHLATMLGYDDGWEHAVADATGRTVYDVVNNGITIKDASKAINKLKARVAAR